MKPKSKDITTDDPIAYVLSLNLERRHVTTGQLSAVAARAKTLKAKLEEEAKDRMRDGGEAAGKGRPQ